ncbi:TVP38/TMEM64 family protein [Candidatus Rhabdochlamydia porcellionis]|uniref:TVP38/TMEM64 family membrane protein n=1 Tax=Candidatus Rhabdochlamydia porcellionis TaxID=225148 RepID=A0ABX8Z0E6_9BACT|nr:VTT domain-containing protein [Candidatus Rhabdochlamydia porcellionis]QZA59129.1 SNARE associated Golgi protein [Candidatus Rhabdochlamydia porcellionis]
MTRKWLPFLPILIILFFVLYFFLTGKYKALDFNLIKSQHVIWEQYVQDYPILSGFCFILIHTISVILIIPASTLLTLIAGFLFPLPLAIAYTCFSETLGAVIFFFIMRTAFFQFLSHRKKAYFIHLRESFYRYEISYLLFLRFSHILPFWLINLLSAVFRVNTYTFIWTTCVGVLPLIIVLAQAGGGLSTFFRNETDFSFAAIFNTQIKLSLLVLALLALLPILLKKCFPHKKALK